MRHILVVAALLILSSCATQKRCSNKFPPAENSRIDSVYIYRDMVRWKDTIIYKELPPVVIERYASIKDTLKLTGSYSEAFAWVSDGNILGKLNEGIKPAKIEYKIKEVEVIKTKVVREVEQVKFVPKFTQWFAWVGIIALILIIIKVSLRFLK